MARNTSLLKFFAEIIGKILVFTSLYAYGGQKMKKRKDDLTSEVKYSTFSTFVMFTTLGHFLEKDR